MGEDGKALVIGVVVTGEWWQQESGDSKKSVATGVWRQLESENISPPSLTVK